MGSPSDLLEGEAWPLSERDGKTVALGVSAGEAGSFDAVWPAPSPSRLRFSHVSQRCDCRDGGSCGETKQTKEEITQMHANARK
jgi:hypothetical protein